ncbi:hypothetical protein QBC34DRAFT_386607 [Podospora aff. communis PSN243]|uniref:Uncharacterized protein n=1 Tax=Podospora aff. communis PSN243 TaxID=3040156 RepID=A0AAV9G4U2_9PEZI|nr:hypothetical protein QBC34DRAFT_386607 [Podospora aff. communis PSN243]
MRSLTDNLSHLENTSDVALWDGLAKPTPPEVNSHYWTSVYKRADDTVCAQVLQEVAQEDPNLKGEAFQTEVQARCQRARSDEDRTTYCLAMENLIHDLVCVAEGDFVYEVGRTKAQNRARMAALKETRKNLTTKFFDWVKWKVDVVIVPREMLDPEELALVDGKPQWYGKGGWMTTMEL